MQIRCPHCQNPVESLDEFSIRDISCSNCGSSIDLVVHQTVLADAPAPSRPIGKIERCLRWCKRNPVVAFIVMCCIVWLLGNGITLWLRAKSDSKREMEARDAVAREMERADEDLERAMAVFRRGTNQYGLGKLEEAEQSFLQAESAFRRLREKNPDVAVYQSGLAQSYHNLGVLYDAAGKPEEAKQQDDLAIEFYNRLIAENSIVSELQSSLAEIYQRRGVRFQLAANPEAAIQQFDLAIQIRERLVTQDPNVAEYQIVLAASYGWLSHAYEEMGKPEEAKQQQKMRIEVLERVAAKNPGVANYRQPTTIWG